MDCSPPGFSVHGVLQARILEWVAISSSRASSQPRNKTGSPALQADSLLLELPGKSRWLQLYANYILYLALTFIALALQTISCIFLFLHIRKKGQGHWTVRLNSWLLTPVYDCFWNNARERRIQDSHTFVPHHYSWLVALILYKPRGSSWSGDSSWGMSLLFPSPTAGN